MFQVSVAVFYRRAFSAMSFVALILTFYYLRTSHHFKGMLRNSRNDDTRQNQIPSSRKVILLSYARSGSSFLGGLFSSNPEACYWYEPVEGALHHIYGFTRHLKAIDMMYGPDGQPRHIPNYEIKTLQHFLSRMLFDSPSRMPLDFLYGRFTIRSKVSWNVKVRKCIQNYTGLDAHDPFITYKMRRCMCRSSEPKLERLRECYANRTLNQSHDITLALCLPRSVKCHRKCVQRIQSKAGKCVGLKDDWCRSSKMSVTKTVRLSMTIVEDMLEENPEILVVHYVRDPRGMYLSMKDAKLMSQASRGDWFREMEMVCANMMNNIRTAERIYFKYPNNVMTLRYEDLAETPLKHAEALYSFINISLPSSVKTWIVENTEAKTESGRWGTSRKDSHKTSRAWMKKISEDEAIGINKRCGLVLAKLGYAQDYIIENGI